MENKERIKKIKEVSELIEKSIKTQINYDEFNKMEDLLDELNIVSKPDFISALNRLGFESSDDVYNVIKGYKKQLPARRMKLNEFIGELSGSTMNTQIKMIKEYKQAKKKLV